MIQMGTMLAVADNSGARRLQAIRQLGGSSAPRYAGIGDIVVCSVKEAAPESEIKKGTVVIDLWDRQRAILIWRGIAPGVLKKGFEGNEARLGKALERLMKRWDEMYGAKVQAIRKHQMEQGE